MHLPTAFLDSLALTKGFDRTAFEKVHADGEQITSIRLNPRKKFEFRNSNFEFLDIPWAHYGFYLKERPSFNPTKKSLFRFNRSATNSLFASGIINVMSGLFFKTGISVSASKWSV